jgi:phosphatidylserine/phosphatidylglycerophosphate/cardiolipin synthase-like enzyme
MLTADRGKIKNVVSDMAQVQTVIGAEFPKEIIPLIHQAKHSLDILVFDWRWYPSEPDSPVQLFNQAILQAAKRGIKVRALVNHLDIVDLLRKYGVDARKANTKTLVHAKLMIVDSDIVVVGSHNYTQSAFERNFECSLIVKSDSCVAELQQYYNGLFLQYGHS